MAKKTVARKADAAPVANVLNAPSIGASYMRTSRGVTIHGSWQPALREAFTDVRDGWHLAAARVVDMIQNSGFISGIVDQAVANIVGDGLRLKSQPDTDRLRISAKQAADLGRTIERRFQEFTTRPTEIDLEGRKTFGQLQGQAVKQFFAYGEVLAILPWRRVGYGHYGTKVRMLPPSRLAKDNTLANVYQGIELDRYGMPVAVHIEDRGTTEEGIPKNVRIAIRDRVGRPQVVHAFDGMPGQVRGITVFAPVVNVMRQFDQLQNATLTTAILQQVFAATIESAEPTKEFMQALQTPKEMAAQMAKGDKAALDSYVDVAAGWQQETNLDLGIAGRMAYLFPGQQLKLTKASDAAGNYKEFANYLMREIARCAGLTFENATGDYSAATYSSVRVATSAIWDVTCNRRAAIAKPFCQAVFEAWLEECVMNGQIEVPGGKEGFYRNLPALARSEWIGPPKPQADELKTARAFEVLRRMGILSDADIAGQYGLPIEDVYEQRRREKDMRREYGLHDPEDIEIMALGDKAAADDAPEDDEEE